MSVLQIGVEGRGPEGPQQVKQSYQAGGLAVGRVWG
jgi:hypothetical protein